MQIKKYLKQRMVYWVRTGTGSSGQAIYGQPAERRCRWDDLVAQVQTLTKRTFMSKAEIMLDEPVVVGSLIYKGTIASWKALPTYPKVPTTDQGGYEVQEISSTPAKNGKPLLFTVYL